MRRLADGAPNRDPQLPSPRPQRLLMAFIVLWVGFVAFVAGAPPCTSRAPSRTVFTLPMVEPHDANSRWCAIEQEVGIRFGDDVKAALLGCFRVEQSARDFAAGKNADFDQARQQCLASREDYFALRSAQRWLGLAS